MKRNMKPTASQYQVGFTLVELMVSIAIGLFLLTVIGGLYLSSNRAFSTTSATSAMDENARTIFDFIGVSVRQAGFNGCAGFSGTIVGDTRLGPAFVTGWQHDTANPVQGLALTASDPRFLGSLPNTDVLMLVGVDSQREASVISDNGTTITTGTHTFLPEQVLLASDCQLNSFFVMDGGGGNTIMYGGANSCDANIGTNCAGVAGAPSVMPVPYTLPPGALITPIVANAYYIANSGTAGKGRSLWNCTTENLLGTDAPKCDEMTNGVENLRLSFALDTTGSGSIDRYVPTNAVTNWAQVRAVKVNLLLATLPDSSSPSTGSNQYTFNGVAVTPTDRRIYREYTTVFSIRNKTL